jgi:hypothetical protein
MVNEVKMALILKRYSMPNWTFLNWNLKFSYGAG